MHNLQAQLEQRFEQTRKKFRYTLEGGRVRFSQEARQLQRRYRINSLRYVLQANWRSVATAPVIYAMIVPLVIVDLSFTLYQHICFRAYGVPRVRRREYLVNDRHKLAYLNTIEKLNCTYCGYGNGIIAYAREIVSRTEQYWCPIRHAHRLKDAHQRYSEFFDFGDAESYQRDLDRMRQSLKEEQHAPRK